jgi:hypothetical protein
MHTHSVHICVHYLLRQDREYWRMVRVGLMLYLALACRLAVGGTFVVSAVGKVHSRSAFQRFVAWLAVLPLPVVRRRAGLVADVIAAAEALIVILVALPWTARLGLALAAAVLAMFTAGTWLALARGAHLPCLCFGGSASPLGRRHVARDALLCVVAVAGAAAARPGGTGPAGAAISLAAGLVVGGFVVFLDDLADLFRDTGKTVPGAPAQ